MTLKRGAVAREVINRMIGDPRYVEMLETAVEKAVRKVLEGQQPSAEASLVEEAKVAKPAKKAKTASEDGANG